MPAHTIHRGFRFSGSRENPGYSGGAAPVPHRIALKTPSFY